MGVVLIGAGSCAPRAQAPDSAPVSGPSSTSHEAPADGASAAGDRYPIRLSPSARAMTELVQALSAQEGSGVDLTAGSELDWLEQLHDDPLARGKYSGMTPGIAISGTADKLELVGRFGCWEQGGEVAQAPPLTAIRVVSLAGLDAAQTRAVVSLAVDTMLSVQRQRWPDPPARSPHTVELLESVVPILDDARAKPDCVAPCQSWPWQTRWSVLTTYGRAAWREGERSDDAALLEKSVHRVLQALGEVPDAHPLTRAVSERLLGAVRHSLYLANRDEAVLTESLENTQSTLIAFQGPEHRYDWAISQRNLERSLRARLDRSASPGAADEALAASELALGVLDDKTPHLRVRALIGRSKLFERRWARSHEPEDLSQAVQLLTVAADVRGVTAPGLIAQLALERCDKGSELAFLGDDESGLREATGQCEHALAQSDGLSEPRRAGAYHVHGLALGRLGVSSHERAIVERSVQEFEKALEAADRAPDQRAGASVRANYAWALQRLASYTSDAAQLQKASVMISEALKLVRKEDQPFLWGELKQLEGGALYALGWNVRALFQIDAAIRLYQQARAAYAEALTVFPKAESPKRWARLMEKIGASFAREGEISRSQVPLFNQSIASYQRALSVNRQNDDPLAFARTEFGLGSTYLIWAEEARYRAQVKTPATRAVHAFETAIEIYEKAGKVTRAANARAHLADALDELERATGVKDCRALALRVQAFRANPRAQGLWMPVEATLARYDPKKLDRTQCAEVDESFWQRPSPVKKK